MITTILSWSKAMSKLGHVIINLVVVLSLIEFQWRENNTGFFVVLSMVGSRLVLLLIWYCFWYWDDGGKSLQNDCKF